MIPNKQNQNGRRDSATGPIQFLQDFFGEKPWVLVAIRNKRDVRAQTFEPIVNRDKRADDWISRFNSTGFDVYFSINPLRKALARKARKEDVAYSEFLWVDLDPEEGVDLDRERCEMVSLLTDRRPQGVPEPTLVIYSGRGVWAFWKLRTPHPVDGYGPQTKMIESYGRGLEREFASRADDCRNIDRVARLPGTINHKTGKQSKVISYKPENVYDLTELPPPEPARDGNSSDNKSRSGRPRAAHFDTVETAELDKLPVSNAIKHLVRTGKYPNEPGRYRSRSEAVLAVLVAMAANGCSDNVMAAVMRDACLPIGEHIRDQPNPAKYLLRQIESARTMARPSRWKRSPHDGRTPQVVLNSQKKELRSLHNMRRLNLAFDDWILGCGIDLARRYDPAELGELVGFTVEEDERFATEPLGRRAGHYLRGAKPVQLSAARFPKFLMPARFTKEQTWARRKEFKKPKRAEAERRRRAEKRAAAPAGCGDATNLGCRPRAIQSVLTDRWCAIRDIAEQLSGSPAFSGLTNDSLRRAIARELAKPRLALQVEKRTIWLRNVEIAQFRRPRSSEATAARGPD